MGVDHEDFRAAFQMRRGRVQVEAPETPGEGGLPVGSERFPVP